MDLLGVFYCLLVSTSLGQAMWWDGFDTHEGLSNFSVCEGPDSDWIDYRVHSVDFRDLSSRYPNIPYGILDQLASAVGIWGLLYFESIPAWVRDPHSFSCVGNFQTPSHVRIRYFLYGGSFIEVTSGGNLLQKITNDCATSCTPDFKEAIFPLTIDWKHDLRIRMNTTTATDVVLIDDISFGYQDTPPTTATTTTSTTSPSITTTSTATTNPSTTMTSPTENKETTSTFQTTTDYHYSSQAITSTTEATTVTAETTPTIIGYTASTELLKSTASIPDPGEATSTPDVASTTSQANTTSSISTSNSAATGDQDASETSTSPEFTSTTDYSTAATTPDGASVTQLSWSLLLFSFCLYKLSFSVSS